MQTLNLAVFQTLSVHAEVILQRTASSKNWGLYFQFVWLYSKTLTHSGLQFYPPFTGRVTHSDSCWVELCPWCIDGPISLCLCRMPCLLCWNRQPWSWRRGRREGAAHRPWKTAGKWGCPWELTWLGPGPKDEIPKYQGNQQKCSSVETENLSPRGFSIGKKAVYSLIQ